jgi:predicted transcriptional regulator
MNMAKPEILLTPRDIAAEAGVTRQAIQKDIQANRLVPDATTTGRASLFKKATADRYVQEREWQKKA